MGKPRAKTLTLDDNTIRYRVKDKVFICDKETGVVLKRKRIVKKKKVKHKSKPFDAYDYINTGIPAFVNADSNGCLNGDDINSPTFMDLLFDESGKFDD